MSAFEEYNLSPGAVARLTEPTPDLQRNYRQRGMLDSYGELQENGRWMYSLRDLVGIWVSDRLSLRGQGLDRRDSLRYGHSLAPNIFENVKVLSMKGGFLVGSRYFAVLTDGYSEDMRVHGSQVKSFNALAEIENEQFDHVLVIDTHRLAKTVPPTIATLLLLDAENEADEGAN